MHHIHNKTVDLFSDISEEAFLFFFLSIFLALKNILYHARHSFTCFILQTVILLGALGHWY